MTEERRSAPRARISGARVVYDSAIGDRIETDALNLGRGGLFVRTGQPLAVGKRLAFEIQVPGELVPWSALGRVVWAREKDEGERRPPGMGVKLIDVEDAAVATIERLVAERAQMDPGIQEVDLGAPPVPAARIVSVPPTRERTILGVGSTFPAPVLQPEPRTAHTLPPPREPEPTREPSVAIDLVAGNPPAAHSQEKSRRESDAPLEPEPRPVSSSETPAPIKPGGSRWIVVLLLLAVAAVATYLILDGDLDRVLRPSEPSAAPQPLPVPPTPPRPTVTATPAPVATPAQTATSSPTSTGTSTATGAGSTPTPSSGASAPRKWPLAPAPPPSHAIPKRPAEDSNPY
jgi:uncharacterized protein (TIGR02266 family)